MMIKRKIMEALEQRLNEVPAVVLLGARQSGKTTLALKISESRPSIYLDLESELDRAKLSEPELYLQEHTDKLVIIDEIHRVPALFPVLRGIIDRSRRKGNKTGLFLLLGSAALEILHQSAETLAGRVSYFDLNPFNILETKDHSNKTWIRGGFPESFLADSDSISMKWRRDFIRSYLERDIPQFGSKIPSERLRRLWIMLAHNQGGILNKANLARNIGVDTKTASKYIDLLTNLLLVKQLQPWFSNIGKRIVKSPKVYVRDSGLVHTLLSINNFDSLLSHPILGMSWEGFVIEQITSLLPDFVEPFFYRTSSGAEIDLVLVFPNGEKWAIEIKRSIKPKLSKGFYFACNDIKPTKQFVVYSGSEDFPLDKDTKVISVYSMCNKIDDLSISL